MVKKDVFCFFFKVFAEPLNDYLIFPNVREYSKCLIQGGKIRRLASKGAKALPSASDLDRIGGLEGPQR